MTQQHQEPTIEVLKAQWESRYNKTLILYIDRSHRGSAMAVFAALDVPCTPQDVSPENASYWLTRQQVLDAMPLREGAAERYQVVHAEVERAVGKPVPAGTPLATVDDLTLLAKLPSNLMRKHDLALLEIRIEEVENQHVIRDLGKQFNDTEELDFKLSLRPKTPAA